MDRKLCISLVILALVLLAGPGAKAATLSIDAARQLMPSSMRLEDGVAPELAVVSTAVDLEHEVHRRVLASQDFHSGVFNRNSPACKGSCLDRGEPYTGRGCDKKYGCKNMPT